MLSALSANLNPLWQCHRIGMAARLMGVLVILIVNPQFAWNHFNSFGI